MAIVIAACGVDNKTCTEVAYKLAKDNDLYSRPLALAGIWGSLVRQWLEEVLPEDCAELCSSRVTISVMESESPIPWIFPLPYRRKGFSRFESKADLIDCLMASVHIPFFLDFRPFATYKDKLCIDGSALRFENGLNGVRQDNGDTIKPDLSMNYGQDDAIDDEYFDFLRLRTLEGVYDLIQQGENYAARTDLEILAPYKKL